MFHAILAPTSSSFYHILILTDASKILYILRDNENSNFSIYLEFRLILKFKVSNKFVLIHNTVPIERKTHRNPSKKQSLCPTKVRSFPRSSSRGKRRFERRGGFLRHTFVSFSHVQRSSQARSGSTCPALNGHSHSHLCPRPRHSLAHCNDP